MSHGRSPVDSEKGHDESLIMIPIGHLFSDFFVQERAGSEVSTSCNHTMLIDLGN